MQAATTACARHRRARPPASAVLAAALMLLLGCSAEQDESDAAPAAGSAPAGTTTQAVPPLASTAEPEAAETGETGETGQLAQLIDAPTLEPFTGDLPAMKERGVVRALVVPSRTGFFVADGSIKGIQAEFLRKFEEHLNRGVKREAARVKIQFVPVSFGELIPGLLAGRGDIAAHLLTVTPKRQEQVAFVDGFRLEADEIVVAFEKAERLERLEDLAGRQVLVLEGSSYADHLAALNTQLAGADLEPVRVQTTDSHLRSEDVLELVNAGVAEYTVVDDYKARLWARVMPALRLREDIALRSGTTVAWAVRPDAEQLLTALETFSRQVRKGSLLGNVLFERYYENVKWIKNPAMMAERDKLARYIDLFEKYGQRYDFDALALAAQAYHESGLDHSARSHRGAIGIMQVRKTTAQDPKVGIDDIHELENNIHAGTKYLAFLRDHYFSDPAISDWDRRAFSWAAYNAGPRKLRRARARARELGVNPNVWFGNVEIATGEMVGREPVRYVASIYIYYTAYKLLRARQSPGGPGPAMPAATAAEGD